MMSSFKFAKFNSIYTRSDIKIQKKTINCLQKQSNCLEHNIIPLCRISQVYDVQYMTHLV